MKWKFGNRDWSPLQGVPTPDDCKFDGSPQYDVAGFGMGEQGTTVDGLAVDVPFVFWMGCDGDTFSMSVDQFELVAKTS